jgi:hypothetical protein
MRRRWLRLVTSRMSTLVNAIPTDLLRRPEFKREFSLWTSFCVSFAVLGLLPSFASTLYFGMGYAGTPGMVWGWLIAMSFIQCVAMGMGKREYPQHLPEQSY